MPRGADAEQLLTTCARCACRAKHALDKLNFDADRIKNKLDQLNFEVKKKDVFNAVTHTVTDAQDELGQALHKGTDVYYMLQANKVGDEAQSRSPCLTLTPQA